MAISVDPLTDVIYVPKADLTLIQASPEVRELDVDWFRLELLDWEDGEDAIPRPKTHTHNTEVTLAGLTYARIIEILSPYTIEFEDGQYTVNCVGANHNISDKKVANQVSLIVNNAAGLITNSAIEYSSFNGGVTIDTGNISGKAIAGTLFPIGTPQAPSNNINDAFTIAEFRGFPTFYVLGDLDITSAVPDLSNYQFIGSGMDRSEIAIDPLATVDDCEYREATISGTLDGNNRLVDCMIEDLIYVKGIIERCVLSAATITLGGAEEAHFLDCWSGVPGTSTPTINMGGSGQALALRNYNGGIKLTNKTGAESVSIDLNSGQIILDSTVTNGDIVCRGIGKLTDESTGSANVLADDLLSKEIISEAVWDEDIGTHLISGTTGWSVGIQQFGGRVTIDVVNGSAGTAFPIGTEESPVNNIPDAIAIANTIGVKAFLVKGSITAAGGPFEGYHVYGESVDTSTIIASNLDCQGVTYENCKITGTFVNNSYITTFNCTLEDVTDIEITAWNTSFGGFIQLINSQGKTVFYNCFDDIPGIGIPDIRVNTCESLGIWNFNGGIRISNMITASTVVSLMIAQGRLWVDSTCTHGDIIVKGLADLRGETNGTTIDSEGLITKDTLTEAAWETEAEFVYIDLSSGYSGTTWPVGTPAQPVNNVAEAKIIADSIGVRAYKIVGQVVFTDDYDKWRFHGWTAAQNDVFVAAGCNITNSNFEKIAVTGTFGAGTANNELLTGFLSTSTGFNAVLVGVGITGAYTMGGEGSVLLGQQVSWIEYPHTLDMVGVNRFCKFHALSGDVLVTNMGAGSLVQCTLNGSLTLDASCTGGTLIIRGTNTLTDNSGGAVTIIESTLNQEVIADAVWSSTSGLQVLTDLSFIAGIEGGKWEIAGGQMIFYLDDNTTEIARFDLTYDANQNPVMRTRV